MLRSKVRALNGLAARMSNLACLNNVPRRPDWVHVELPPAVEVLPPIHDDAVGERVDDIRGKAVGDVVSPPVDMLRRDTFAGQSLGDVLGAPPQRAVRPCSARRVGAQMHERCYAEATTAEAEAGPGSRRAAGELCV